MAVVGLFPLEIVLLPGERVPLHIFEERYKELIGESIAASEEFGLVFADDDGARGIGTRAAVVEVLQRYDDGRMDIVVEGRERFRALGVSDEGAFLTADVEPYSDEQENVPVEEAAACRAAFAELAEVVGSEDVEVQEQHGLAFGIAAHVEFAPEVKQALLEYRSERERVVHLTALLSAAVEQVRYRALAEERAVGNGKVGH